MNPPRRVIFVRPSLSVSGADRWAIDAAIALQNRGWHVEIVVNFHNPAWTQPEAASGQVTVTALGGVPLWGTFNRLRAVSSLINQWILLWRIRRRGSVPDLFVGDIVPQALTAMRKYFPTSAVLYYCHFPDRLGVTSRGLYGIYREAIGRQEDRAMRVAHRVLANSHYTAEAVRRTFSFLAEERLAIVQPGVRLTGTPTGQGASPRDATASKRVLLSVARFDPRKGLDLAVEAFAEMRDRIGPAEFGQWRLVLAGGFDRRLPEVRALVEQLRTQASTLGIADQVELQFDPSDEALEALWREAFAMIHPAPAEHFGIVLIEAMAHRLPVLAVDYGGPREIVVDGVTGALRPPDAGKFADVLAQWARAPALAAALGIAGRERAEAEFSMDRFSAKFAAQAELALAQPSLP
jgi:alpha-1,3/alpha-1,6-mannosyltransferase